MTLFFHRKNNVSTAFLDLLFYKRLFIKYTFLIQEVKIMSFESAKKLGYRASILNIIIPVIVVLCAVGVLFQIIYQVINNPGAEPDLFGIGFLIGIIIAAAIIGIIAFVMFVLSMYKLSNYYKEPAIFRNIIYSFIISIIFSTILSVVVSLTLNTAITDLAQAATNDFNSVTTMFTSLLSLLAAIIFISIGLGIIQGILYWQAFTKLGEKSGVEGFKTTGLLYLIGSIINGTGIGAILIWIAWITAAKNYKQLQPQPNPPTAYNTTSTLNTVYCSSCGTENNANDTYCKHCGNTLQTVQTNP